MSQPEALLPARVPVKPRSSDSGGDDYDVLIGSGLLADLPASLVDLLRAARYAVIADSNTGPLYGAPLTQALSARGLLARLYQFPAGEAHKNREQWSDLSDRLLLDGCGRDAAVIAVGGGVTGDLAGFVAATFMRGLPLVQVPTSLLAMIDSSVGGKTGVDTPASKNLIGAFLQPAIVVADTLTLRTLPPQELHSGMAEAVKHGAIADESYFDWIGGAAAGIQSLDPSTMLHLVRRSVEIKAAVVGEDEKEQGRRKTLNFGHTIGHAVEALSSFRLLHGQAISIGMVAEARLGERLGVTESGTTERVAEGLTRWELPIAVPASYAAADILDLTRSDKKARAGKVEYSLIERIGSASPGTGSYGIPMDDALVLEVLEECRTPPV